MVSERCFLWSGCDFAWQAPWILRLVKSEPSVLALQQFQKGWQAWDVWRGCVRMRQDACRVASAVTRDISSRYVKKPGCWFPERGCILEHQMFRFAKMFLCDRCSTSYEMASLFHGRRSTLDRWSGKIAKRIGTRSSALHSTFYFWRKPRFFDKIEEVAELPRFWRCQVQNLRKSCILMLSGQVQKIRKSRRMASFFDVVKFKNWGSVAEWLPFS